MASNFEELAENRIRQFKEQTTLSERESEVMAYKSLGVPASDIADELGIAENTVNEYVNRARSKAKDGFLTFKTLETFGLVTKPEAYD